MFIILSSPQQPRNIFIACFKVNHLDEPFCTQANTCAGYCKRCVDARVDKSRHTPVPGGRDFPTISFVRVILCATYLHACARDLSIYLLTTGVILRRRAAIKPRRAEFTVTGSNSFVLLISLLLSFFAFLLPSFPLSLALLLGAGLTELYGQSHGIVDWLDPMIDGALA